MKFIKDRFPESGFEPEAEGYTRMKEPDMHTLIWVAIPIGVVVAALMFLFAQTLTQTTMTFDLPVFRAPKILVWGAWLYGFLMLNIVMVPLHEFIHALFFPEPLKSDNIYFGMFSFGAFFAYYALPMSRGRMIGSLMTPFLLLSVIPWMVIVLLDIDMPILMIALLYHTLSAAGDLVGVFLVIKNTPRGAVLRNKGYETYYKA